MPHANIRGVHINYEVLGTKGPWIALTPGGRRPLEAVKSLAEKVARAGYRVLIHDRRNCGASDVSIDATESEYEIWVGDLRELLSRLGAVPAIIGGSSSGCRLAILYALRHPQEVSALLLWRITGGRFAAERLAENYYSQFIRAAEAGGMAAVCEMEHFRERIEARPSNRERLMSMDPAHFIRGMASWREHFIQGADLPIIGASEADLRSIAIPAIAIPGNDRTHDIQTGRNLTRLMPDCELYDLFDHDEDMDLVPQEAWQEKDDEIARVFVDFLARVRAPAKAAARG
jgi:pimeloyl-ACP methyl ester carboxylesterase